MTNVIVNKKYIIDKLGVEVLNKYVQKYNNKIKNIIKKNNQELLNEFLRDEITKEIQNGAKAYNTSNTLQGRGNLFTFLGFEKNDQPILELTKFLSNCIKLENIKINKSNFSLNIIISIPSEEDFNEIAQLPWINKGLVQAIEKGVSGLGNYLYSEKGFKSSRSQKAIQSKSQIYSVELKTRPYLSKIIRDISKKLVENIKNNI